MLDAGYWILDTGYRMKNGDGRPETEVGCRI